MPNIGKLLKLGDKMLTYVNKNKLGEPITTYIKDGKTIEVFKKTKKVGFKGKERTFRYKYNANEEAPFEISITEKDKKGFANYTYNFENEKTSRSLTCRTNANNSGINRHYTEKYDLNDNLIETHHVNVGNDGEYLSRTATKYGDNISVKDKSRCWDDAANEFKVENETFINDDFSFCSHPGTFDPKTYKNDLFLNDKVTGSIAAVLGTTLLGCLIWGIKELINSNSTNNNETNADLTDATANNESSQAAESETPTEETDETEVAQDEEPTTSDEGTESNAVEEQPSQPQRGTAEEGNNSQQTTVAERNNSEDSSAIVHAGENEEPANTNVNNLFNGEINEIATSSVVVVKGDCLWNIAKRELMAANPDKIITNAQILKQVKEFGRLNPEIEDLNLIYPEQTIKLRA